MHLSLSFLQLAKDTAARLARRHQATERAAAAEAAAAQKQLEARREELDRHRHQAVPGVHRSPSHGGGGRSVGSRSARVGGHGRSGRTDVPPSPGGSSYAQSHASDWRSAGGSTARSRGTRHTGSVITEGQPQSTVDEQQRRRELKRQQRRVCVDGMSVCCCAMLSVYACE